MGLLYDDFSKLTYRNEAEVSQNFILPLLEHFLGYQSSEILPESYYKVKDVYSGVKFSEGGSKSYNHRPDYVICLNGDQDDPKFIIDSKGPDEGIDDHLGQLLSYAISVGKNLLMMTNGKEIKVYDVNELLFYSTDIDDLQLKLDALVHLLGRTNQALMSQLDILQSYNHDKGVTADALTKIDQEIQKRRVILNDFNTYLSAILKEFESWHLPTQYFQALDNLQLQKIDPYQLLSFNRNSERRLSDPDFGLVQIIRDPSVRIKVFSGETGTGKTSLLKYLTFKVAHECLIYRELTIPVYVQLREIGKGFTLENLIINTLNRFGYHCSSLSDLPPINDFVFYLDACDEINEELRKETFEAIERLSIKSTVYLTTRPGFIPRFKPSLIFDIQPISEDQANRIIKNHIDDNYYDFNRQLEKHNLKNESRNILLLLFLISLYKETGTFPATVNGIIRSIVARVRQWQESKSPFATTVEWEALEKCLAQCAFHLMQSGETAIQITKIEDLLLPVISEMERRRKLPQGITIAELIGLLAETGLLIDNKDHFYFWHRLFIYHFASIGLKAKYNADLTFIDVILPEPRWHVVISALATQLQDVTALVQAVETDIWIAAYCLIENAVCETETITRIINTLIIYTRSEVADIRMRACSFLSKIDSPVINQFFFSVIDRDFPIGVKMFALSAIGKTKTNEALAIINQYLEWDESEYWVGPYSLAYVARGLYYYGETEHLQIIKNWRKTYNWLMAQECKHIFIELFAEGRLTSNLIEALELFFSDEYKADQSSQETLGALAQILNLCADDDFFIVAIDMAFVKDELNKTRSIEYLLADCKSMAVMQHLKTKIMGCTGKRYTAQELIDVLVNSSAPIPKAFFYELTEHENSNIAANAIGALSRYDYQSVREKVEEHLFGEQPQLQSWALRVLVDNGEIINTVQEDKFPPIFYLPTAHTLLRAVRTYHLADALPLLLRIKNALIERQRYEGEVTLALELAASYYLLGENGQHEEIISWFFDGQHFLQKSDNVHFHIMKDIKSIDPKYGIQLADCYFRTYFPFDDQQKIRFKMGVFLEAVEDLGQSELTPRVKEIAEMLIAEAKNNNKQAGFDLERPLRALVGIAQPADEDWILDKLKETDYDPGFEFPQLRRAVESLAHIGTKKALPFIQNIASHHKENILIMNVCQNAYEQICNREKIPKAMDVLAV